MAVSGLSKLEAVNEMLNVINQGRASGLDNSGTWPPPSGGGTLAYGSAIAGKAEQMLDTVSRRMQMQGFPENTNMFKQYTPSGSPFVQALAATVLWLRSSGPTGYRNFTIKGVSGTSYIWDFDNRTNEFASAAVLTVDEIVWLDFDNLQPRNKELVVTAAATFFQWRTRGSPDMADYLTEEKVIADLLASRIQLRLTPEPINPSPMLAAVLGRQRGAAGGAT